jgi:hypothetical protein
LGMGIVSANGGNCVNGNGNGNGNGNVVVGGANGNGNAGGGESPVPRRNSLGDLKIPARISQAQVSLRRDIGFVRVANTIYVGIPMTTKEFAELELFLLYLQQNVEIPETHVLIHPTI